MRRKLAALFALMILLSGCAASLEDILRPYPRAELGAPPAVEPATLELTLPQNAGDAMDAAAVLLEAKLGELSGGAIGLKTYRVGDTARAMDVGEPGLYLLSSAQMVAMEESLEFIQMPFLFEKPDQLLDLLGNPEGITRSSGALRERLGGEILGIYYGGTSWFIGKGRFYDEVGFYNSVGVLSGNAGNSCFGALGAQNILEGTPQELFTAFTEGKAKFCELRPGDEIPPEALAAIRSLELTGHRYETSWLILHDPAGQFSPDVKLLVKEAYAYTVGQHRTLQQDSEAAYMARLEEQLNLTLREEAEEPYRNTWQSARRYYRENWELLEIPEKLWQEITLVRGY